ESLEKLLESKVIPDLGVTDGMSVKQKVRKIYEYVNTPSITGSKYNNPEIRIGFDDESNIPNINRANWETDWMEEAYLTLSQSDMWGDCYSYYSVSKALFRYYGIDHIGIRRNDAASQEPGTHFWLIVNIGSQEDEKWYFYDATRLAGTFSATGDNECCLLTEAQLATYSNDDFYVYEQESLLGKTIQTQAVAS
ncbi:MAG: hypothetical protein IJY42_05605, partial [Clostridia bacterium]|nr:hypothetical protein [Clostridia bacterium]